MSNDFIELAIRQYVSKTISSLNRSIFRTYGSNSTRICAAIPPERHHLLMHYGFNSNFLVCTVLWYGYITKCFFLGIIEIFVSLIPSKNSYHLANFSNTRRAYLCDLNPSILIGASASNSNLNVISWISRWLGSPTSDLTIFHNVPQSPIFSLHGCNVISLPCPIDSLRGLKNKVKFIVEAVYLSYIVLSQILRGRWFYSLLLKDLLIASRITLHNSSSLPDYIFFHNSRAYPPLWIFKAIKSGIQVYYYFYSTNLQGPSKPHSELSSSRNQYAIANWPVYLVWDKWHAHFIQKSNNYKKHILVVGPMSFSDCNRSLPKLSRPLVGLFDVQPLRNSLSLMHIPYQLYSPKSYIKFLTDVAEVCKKLGFAIAWKRKRDIGRLAHPIARYIQKHLIHNYDIVEVDPCVSAHRLIQSCDVTVNIPFTSTAIVSSALSTPSVFYDPTGNVSFDDHAAHGIAVVNTATNLERWILSHIDHKKL